jgi:hypothetical protein
MYVLGKLPLSEACMIHSTPLGLQRDLHQSDLIFVTQIVRCDSMKSIIVDSCHYTLTIVAFEVNCSIKTVTPRFATATGD